MGDCVSQELFVLVIEDDLIIQGMIEDVLSNGGYQTVISASGEEGVALLSDRRTKYRALVTDINLSGTVDGWAVAKAARETDPAFPVVYMTGAAADQWAINGVPNSILLAKPFAPAQLVTAISNLLNTGAQLA
jgi:DNA-binding response OmpR family regulator